MILAHEIIGGFEVHGVFLSVNAARLLRYRVIEPMEREQQDYDDERDLMDEDEDDDENENEDEDELDHEDSDEEVARERDDMEQGN